MEKSALKKLMIIQLVEKLFNQGHGFTALHHIYIIQTRGFGTETLKTHQELEITYYMDVAHCLVPSLCEKNEKNVLRKVN